jgi:hypothetical protein
MTDREFIEHTLQWLKLSAEVAPFVQKRVVIDSIEQHLGESRRVPPSTTIINESQPQVPVYGVPAGFEINYSPGVAWGDLVQKCPHGLPNNGMATCLQCADPAFNASSRNNPSPYQTFTLTGMPQAGIKEARDKYQVNGYPYDEQSFQNFWRCKHHPSALDNYFARRECTMGCNMNELRWFDNGTCKPQTS